MVRNARSVFYGIREQAKGERKTLSEMEAEQNEAVSVTYEPEALRQLSNIKMIAESLRLLELTAEDFDRFEEEDEAPAGDRKELSEYTIGSFYSLISDPGFDREIYAGYVDAILPYVAPKSRKYYRAFQPGFSVPLMTQAEVVYERKL